MKQVGASTLGIAKKPSMMRWLVLLVICLMYLITYFDRVNLSAAAPLISKEFHFSKLTMGFILSAFSWTYALGQVPGGWLGDRFGPRRMLSIVVVFWSVMTSLTAYAGSFFGFVVFRGLFGVGEAGAFPTATRAMQLWYTKAERGIVQGVTHSFSRLGAAIGTPIAVVIMAAYGWRAMFIVFGLVGILWAVGWYLLYRNLPEEHTWVNKEELAHIRGMDANGNINPPNVVKKPKVPWGTLAKSSNMWAIMLAYFTYNYVLWIFLSWLPTYLVDFRHFGLIKMGLFASLPLMFGVVGDSFGGWLTDFLVHKSGSARFGRRAVAIGGMIGAIVFIIPAALTSNALVAIWCLAATMFFLESTIGPSWAVTMDVGGEYSGTVSGFMNMGGNIGGALSPIVFGFLVQRLGSWTAPFIVAAGLLVIGVVIWAFWLDPEKQVLVKGSLPAQTPA